MFAQQFAASGAGRFGVPKQNDASQNAEEKKHKIVRMDPSTPKFPKPSLISGEGLVQHAGKKTLLNKEVEEIHDENIAKLESMTQEEILEEQARIRASLGELKFYIYQRKSVLAVTSIYKLICYILPEPISRFSRTSGP